MIRAPRGLVPTQRRCGAFRLRCLRFLRFPFFLLTLGARKGRMALRAERRHRRSSASAVVRSRGGGFVAVGAVFAKRATTLRGFARGCVPAVGMGRGGIGRGGRRVFAKRATTLPGSARGCIPTVAMGRGGIGGAAGGFSRNAQRPCRGPPGAVSWRSGRVAVASAGAAGAFFAKCATTPQESARGCVPAARMGRGGIGGAAGVFSRNAQRPSESLPGAASRRSGWVSTPSAGAAGAISRNAQRPCQGPPGAASRRSGWVVVASAGAACGFSQNAQRPCQGQPGAAYRRSGWVAVASAVAAGVKRHPNLVRWRH